MDGWTDGQMDRWKDDVRQRDFKMREPPVQREKKERAKHICRRGRSPLWLEQKTSGKGSLEVNETRNMLDSTCRV